jgi:UDP-hydrolysing UDP-N-acetyl-D-glucosamine 2-epimerase
MKKKIAVFTGNRAEYGLLQPIIKEISLRSNLELLLFVSGAHLDPAFGKTIDNIRSAEFNIAEEIQVNLNHDDLFSTSLAIGQGILEMAKALQKHKPDILIVYADRFEGFAAVIAASQMRIPVAHIEGGDVTEGGALDDSVRHAMTKLSHLHFTTNEDAMKNVLQMGEEKWRVHNAGLPSLDVITKGDLANKYEIIEKWGIDLYRPIILFTQHSVTTKFDEAPEQIGQSLVALEKLLSTGAQVFITYPNNDAGGLMIIEKINSFKAKFQKDLFVVPALGSYFYHGILSLSKDSNIRLACVGNSSSGIKETPVFGCPTVNIGSRQDGRLRAKNVIDVGYNSEAILKAVEKCLHDEIFRKKCREVENPYGKGESAKTIVDVLSKVEINDELIAKKTTFNS